jgi:hypothetical protein
MVSDTDNLLHLTEIMRQFGFAELAGDDVPSGSFHRVVSERIGITIEPASPPHRPGDYLLTVGYFEKESPAMAMDEGVTGLFAHVGNLGSCLIHSVRFLDTAAEAARVSVKQRMSENMPDFAGMLKGLKP